MIIERLGVAKNYVSGANSVKKMLTFRLDMSNINQITGLKRGSLNLSDPYILRVLGKSVSVRAFNSQVTTPIEHNTQDIFMHLGKINPVNIHLRVDTIKSTLSL